VNGKSSPEVPVIPEVPEATAEPPQQIGELEKLELPTQDMWDVYVTTASSPGNVWVRLVGEAYDVSVLPSRFGCHPREDGAKTRSRYLLPMTYPRLNRTNQKINNFTGHTF